MKHSVVTVLRLIFAISFGIALAARPASAAPPLEESRDIDLTRSQLLNLVHGATWSTLGISRTFGALAEPGSPIRTIYDTLFVADPDHPQGDAPATTDIATGLTPRVLGRWLGLMAQNDIVPTLGLPAGSDDDIRDALVFAYFSKTEAAGRKLELTDAVTALADAVARERQEIGVYKLLLSFVWRKSSKTDLLGYYVGLRDIMWVRPAALLLNVEAIDAVIHDEVARGQWLKARFTPDGARSSAPAYDELTYRRLLGTAELPSVEETLHAATQPAEGVAPLSVANIERANALDWWPLRPEAMHSEGALQRAVLRRFIGSALRDDSVAHYLTKLHDSAPRAVRVDLMNRLSEGDQARLFAHAIDFWPLDVLVGVVSDPKFVVRRAYYDVAIRKEQFNLVASLMANAARRCDGSLPALADVFSTEEGTGEAKAERAQAKRREFEALQAFHREHRKSQQLRDCGVCLSTELTIQDGIECSSGHFSCRSCVDGYIASNVQSLECSLSSLGVKCTGVGCEHMLLPKQIAPFLNDETWRAFVARCGQRIEGRLTREQEAQFEGRVANEVKRREGISALPRETEDAHRHIVANILTLACPYDDCKRAFMDYDGCAALACNGCARSFCALCLYRSDYDGVHAHVMGCSLVWRDGVRRYYVTREVFEVIQRRRRQEMLDRYLQGLRPPVREAVIERVRVNVTELGLTIAPPSGR